ncbi:hypothetical protein KC359_g5 [Hortaea werneckii]|nr:hypothetical protein KC359_g5 [Hortaea werneckii]
MLELLASNGLISSRETVVFLLSPSLRELRSYQLQIAENVSTAHLTRAWSCAGFPESGALPLHRSQTILPLQGLAHLELYYAKSIDHSESMSWVPKRDESQTRRGDIQCDASL